MKKIFILAALCSLFACNNQAKEKPIERFEMEKVAPGIFKILIDQNVNVMVLEDDDNLILVDAGFEDTADSLRKFINNKFNNKPIRAIIFTHFHYDHTGGLKAFPEAVIMTNSFVSDMVEDIKNHPALVVVDSTMDFNQGKRKIHIFNASNSHTKKDLLIFLPFEGVLLTGDILFADRFPFIDLENGGNPANYIKFQAEIEGKMANSTKIIGGHDRVYTLKEFESWAKRLKTSMDLIKKYKDQGLSLEEVMAKKPCKDLKDLSWSFVDEKKWTEIVYNSL